MNLPALPRAAWRLLKTPPAPGDWNMAVDEALLEASGSRQSPPILRLYGWSPPCLSLGYAQSIAEVDFERLHRLGWQIVRRPTGGRAILHTDELTYSVIGPADEPRLAGSVLESYQRLAEALLAALRLLGLPAEATPQPSRPGPAAQGPICFEVPSHYEITVGGKKLIGSAQARRKEAVLQHGSLPLHGDLGRITQALVFPDEASRTLAGQRLLERATTASGVLGRTISWEEAVEAFVQAFSQRLNLDLQATGLTPQEEARAAALRQEKYANLAWTGRV